MTVSTHYLGAAEKGMLSNPYLAGCNQCYIVSCLRLYAIRILRCGAHSNK